MTVHPLAWCRSVLAALAVAGAFPAVAADPPERGPGGSDRIEAGLEEEADQLVAGIADGRASWQARERLAQIGLPAVAALEDRMLFADPGLRRTLVTIRAGIDGAETSPVFIAARALSLGDAVADLRHDTVRWNATYAMDFLRQHSDAARPLLERALESDDHQQRQMAAEVLRGIARYRPTPRMLEVTVEGLRDDVLPYGRRPGEESATTTYVFNAADGVRWFLRDRARIRAAEPLLAAALSSDDEQQRFLAAYLLGRAGCASARGNVVRVLSPHLADNEVRGDANMAAAGLYGLGRAIVPDLRARLPRADAQETLLLRLLIHHLAGPRDPDAAVPPTAQRREITGTVHDPVTQHRFESVPWFPSSPRP